MANERVCRLKRKFDFKCLQMTERPLHDPCAKGKWQTSEFKAEQSCAIRVQLASSAPSCRGSCNRLPLAVTSSLNVNSASPASCDGHNLFESVLSVAQAGSIVIGRLGSVRAALHESEASGVRAVLLWRCGLC